MTYKRSARPGPRVLKTLLKFSQKDDGTITLFGLLMFILMVTIGGIAIDVVRYETQRTQLQYTLDRAVLAAAALNQTQTPEDVIRDYFARSGLERYRLRVEVDETDSSRSVSAFAEADIDALFMDMFGVRALTSPAQASAEERIQNVEIALVVDVSGSMNGSSASGSTKLAELQQAANEFVTAVMQSNDYATDRMRVSVSLVPYAAHVNPGAAIESAFTLTNEHNYSSCTRFSQNQLDRLSLGNGEAIQRLGHFDLYYRTYNSYFQVPYCRPGSDRAILPWSHSVTDLQTEINALQGEGWTAIDQGMRWAIALLDPSSSEELSTLRAAGDVHGDFEGRPSAYDDEETLKIIVLMTDGENTDQWDVADNFRDGPSTIYYHPGDRVWSMYMPDLGLYWIPSRANWDGSNDFWYWYGTWSYQPYRGSQSQPLSWPEVWASYTQGALAWSFYYYASYWSGSWDYFYELRDQSLEMFAGDAGFPDNPYAHERAATADANLIALCDMVRDPDGNVDTEDGVVVFSIAFEAPARGRSLLQDCASTPGHYYDVEGVEISDAFASIANTIETLRLTR